MKKILIVLTILLALIPNFIIAGNKGIKEPSIVRNWCVKHNIFSYSVYEQGRYKAGTIFENFACVIVSDEGNYFIGATALDYDTSDSITGDEW